MSDHETATASGRDADTGATTRPRALVAFASRHGSTEKVAEVVAEGLRGGGFEVRLDRLDKDLDVTGYDAVVVGAPMIMGWHRAARRFVAEHRHDLKRVPTAYFMTAMSLTDTGADSVGGVPVFKDPWLVKPPKDAAKLGRREQYAAPEHYLGDVLRAAPDVRPRAVAFFGGALDLTTMNIFERLFVMLVIGVTPGDARNWKAIAEWSAGLPAALGRAS
jgi:menaquinone-dependent protoporphyrinogen oxidase